MTVCDQSAIVYSLMIMRTCIGDVHSIMTSSRPASICSSYVKGQHS